MLFFENVSGKVLTHHTHKSMKMEEVKIYREWSSFLALSKKIQTSIIPIFYHSFDENDLITQLKNYVASIPRVRTILEYFVGYGGLSISAINRSHDFNNIVVSALRQRNNVDTLVAQLIERQPFNGAILILLAIQNSPRDTIINYASHLSRDEITAVNASLLTRIQGCADDFQESYSFVGTKYLITIRCMQGIPTYYIWYALLRTLMRQESNPLTNDHFGMYTIEEAIENLKQSHVFSDPYHLYIICEIISALFTNINLIDTPSRITDFLQKLSQAKIPHEHFQMFAEWLPLCAQFGQPIENRYWPIEKLPLPATNDTDVSSATMSMLEHTPRALSIFREWMFGKSPISTIKTPSKKPWYSEALLIAITDCGDQSDRYNTVKSLNSHFEISANWREKILACIDEIQSPYHRIRTWCRLIPYLKQKNALKIFKMAYDLLTNKQLFQNSIDYAHSHLLILNAHIALCKLDDQAFNKTYDALLERTQRVIAQCQQHPDTQAILWSKLVMCVSSPKRITFIEHIIQSLFFIQDIHQKAKITRLISPIWQVISRDLEPNLHILWMSFRDPFTDPFALEFAQGKYSRILREFIDQFFELSILGGKEKVQLCGIFLSAVALDLQEQFQTGNTIDDHWRALMESPNEDLITAILKQKSNTNITLSITAALVLDHLLPNEIKCITPILPYLDKAEYDTYPILASWFNKHDNPPLMRQLAALLMVEIQQQLSIGTLPVIIELMSSPIDMLRFRAEQCICHPDISPGKPTRWYSVMNPEVVDKLAQLHTEFSNTHPNLAATIRLLAQDSILDDPIMLRQWLQSLSNANDSKQMQDANSALQLFDYFTPSTWGILVDCIPTLSTYALYEAVSTVSRLLFHSQDNKKTQNAEFVITNTLWQRMWMAIQKVDLSALAIYRVLEVDASSFAQYAINRLSEEDEQMKNNPLDTTLEHVQIHCTTTFTDILQLHQEKALEKLINIYQINFLTLNEFNIKIFHQKVRLLIEQKPNVFPYLLRALHQQLSLTVKDKNKHFRVTKNLLLICAAVVKIYPLQYKEYLLKNVPFSTTLTMRLIEASTQNNSIDGRIAAIELLCHMGILSKAILKVLNMGLHDVYVVRNTILRIGPRTCEMELKNIDLMISILNKQLHNQSTLLCYFSAHLLTTIAISENTLPELKNTIKGLLEDAVSNPVAKRYINFNYTTCKLPAIPRLDQEFMKCVMRICNIPTYDYRYHQSLKEFEQPQESATEITQDTTNYSANNNNIEPTQDTTDYSANNNNVEQNTLVASKNGSPIHHRRRSSEQLNETAHVKRPTDTTKPTF